MSLLQIKGLKKDYMQAGQPIHVLKGVEVEVPQGQIAAIIGQSGSGKSTLLSLLAGLDHPDQGSIKYGDVDITKLNEREATLFRGKNIGIVFQQFHLLSHLTALENVMSPLEILGLSDAEALARKALDQVGLSHRADHFPSQLSGGECQRVAIARAISFKPKFLLADEPSGNLDYETGQKVMQTLFEVIRSYNITALIVTHSEELAKKCDRILHLRQGLL